MLMMEMRLELRFLIHLITEIRHIRAEMNVPLSQTCIEVRGMNELHERSIFNQKAAYRLARLADVTLQMGSPKGARGSVDGLEIDCRWLKFLI